jgi:hypothetical protein
LAIAASSAAETDDDGVLGIMECKGNAPQQHKTYGNGSAATHPYGCLWTHFHCEEQQSCLVSWASQPSVSFGSCVPAHAADVSPGRRSAICATACAGRGRTYLLCALRRACFSDLLEGDYPPNISAPSNKITARQVRQGGVLWGHACYQVDARCRSKYAG